MKRLLALILVLVCCFSLCACGGAAEEEESVEDKVRSSVKSHVMAYVTLSYDINGVPNVTVYIDQTGDNTFEASGKVTVKDKYGDSYTGKYDAEVTYNPETDRCDVDVEVGTLYKD